jgi:hypothetical protein
MKRRMTKVDTKKNGKIKDFVKEKAKDIADVLPTGFHGNVSIKLKNSDVVDIRITESLNMR